MKRGFDDTEPARQRYACHNCDTRFDDLTDTIFAGHHQPLKVWILCLYFMGLNLSNEQIAHEFSPFALSRRSFAVGWGRLTECEYLVNSTHSPEAHVSCHVSLSKTNPSS